MPGANILPQELKIAVQTELLGNILPFWLAFPVDRVKGGFHGSVSNDLTIDDSVERSLVLCARMLWTFSAAYRTFPDPAYLDLAHHAYAYLTGPFLDKRSGGMYWWLNSNGQPVNDRKQTYGQAFAIYALSEFHLATGEQAPLQQAKELFALVEKHARDPRYGGYVEGCSRDWSLLAEMRLSQKERYNCPKSMNTLLHVLEGYTNLVRAWDDPLPRQCLSGLLAVFLDRVIDPQTHFTRLFFEMDWTPLGDRVSFGHDIECSWLLVEAAEALNDPHLLNRTIPVALAMAEAVYRRAIALDGSLFQEGDPKGITDYTKHWWAHAEGIVGFINAAQHCSPDNSPQAQSYIQAALRLWEYIQAHFVDRTHGEWFKELDHDGVPLPSQPKAGPWEDPYHQSRACLEIIRRIHSPR